MMRVDINGDMGEGIGDDAALMPLITSANIACGFHAGDAATMRRTLDLAAQHGVAAGAHPGLPDRAGFGRRVMDVTPTQAYDMVAEQVCVLLDQARAAGVKLVHVKPHGALYNMAAADDGLAAGIATAIRDVDDSLILFGLAGSALIRAAERDGIRSASEVFADRSYESNGALTSRNREGAMIEDPAEAAARAVRMVREGAVVARDGSVVALRADTICVHGDGAHAVAIALRLREALLEAGVQLASPARHD